MDDLNVLTPSARRPSRRRRRGPPDRGRGPGTTRGQSRRWPTSAGRPRSPRRSSTWRSVTRPPRTAGSSPCSPTAADDPLKPASACTLIVLAVEVLVAVGRVDDAAALADGWMPRLRIVRRPLDRGRSRAGGRGPAGGREVEVEAALAASERAISLAERAGIPFIVARALLTAGEVRRRARQKARAREALESGGRDLHRPRRAPVGRAEPGPSSPASPRGDRPGPR